MDIRISPLCSTKLSIKLNLWQLHCFETIGPTSRLEVPVFVLGFFLK